MTLLTTVEVEVVVAEEAEAVDMVDAAVMYVTFYLHLFYVSKL